MNILEEELKKLDVVQMDAGLVFSGTQSGVKVNGFSSASSCTPKIDPDYILHGDAVRDVVMWLVSDTNEAIYLSGPSGCGKSQSIKQLSARLNYPVFEVTGHGRLESCDLIGQMGIVRGNTQYRYGPLALAMKYGGLFLFNEVDACDSSTLIGLNTILDGSNLCISENGGEIITPHPMFRIAFTGNSNGSGDSTGLYTGLNRINFAFTDRLVYSEMSYPEEDVEIKILKKKSCSLPESLMMSMIHFANDIRESFINQREGIDVTMSTRTLIRWATLTEKYQPLSEQGISPVAYALDRAIGFRASPEIKAMLHEMLQRVFGSNCVA